MKRVFETAECEAVRNYIPRRDGKLGSEHHKCK